MEQQKMLDLWQEHMDAEFQRFDVDATMLTMTETPHNINVPTLAGGVTAAEVREFYSKHFLKELPPDTQVTLISRTIGDVRIVDEIIFEFTHSIQMDWMLPAIPATGKKVRIPLVVIVEVQNGKVASEHIYWDQGSLLAQVGFIDPEKFPVAGAEQAQKLLDPQSVPSNFVLTKRSK
jgi:carboxymethylenebutenolidase